MLDDKEKELVRQAFQVMYECNWQAYGSDSTEDSEQGLYIRIGSDLDVEQCPNALKFLNICKILKLVFPEAWGVKSQNTVTKYSQLMKIIISLFKLIRVFLALGCWVFVWR